MKRIDSRIYLEPAEVASIFQVIEEENPDRPDALFLLNLMYTHGLRRNEAILYKKKYFRLEEGDAYIPRLKGGLGLYHKLTSRDIELYNRYMEYAMTTNTFFMDRYLSQENLVIPILVNKVGLHLDIRDLSTILSEASVKAIGHRVNFHSLRHSCAYNMLQNNINLFLVKEYMGHRNISNTCLYLPAIDNGLYQLSSIFENPSVK